MTILEVIIKHYQKLIRFAAKIGAANPQELVQDAVGEILYHPHYEEMREEKKRVAEVMTFIKWRALNTVLSYEAQNVCPLDDVVNHVGENEGTTIRRVDVHRVLQSLPEEDQELVELHFIKGVTVRTLAKQLNVDGSTISRRLGKLRKYLAQNLHDYKP